MRRRFPRSSTPRGTGRPEVEDSSTGEVSRPPHIEGYEELVVIGRGASSTVFRAREARHDRDVAIKVLNIDISDRKARRRFDRERSVNGRLSDHPNVVTVLESGLVDGRQPYLAMELFDQGSLADRLTRRGPFEVADVLHHGIRVAGALESAHRLGVLHRDVKPHNILLSRFGEPALADFGIASLLENERAMTAALTPNHAAPELLEGEEPTAQSDVYSLGSSLYMLLAGTPPFAGPDDEGVLAQLLRITTSELPPIPRSDVPEGLEASISAMLSRRPAERPQTALGVANALQEVQAELGLPVTTIPLDDVGQPGPPVPTPVPPSGPPVAPSGPVGGEDDETIDVPPHARPVRPMTARWDDDPTVGPDVSSPTVTGRAAVVRPARATGTRRRRLPVIVWSLVAIALGVGLIVGVAGLLRGDDGNTADDPSTDGVSADESATDVADPVETADDAALFALAPTDVGVQATVGDAVLVTWDDQADGAVQFIVTARLLDGTDVAADGPTVAGAETATIDVSIDRVECVTVTAVLGRRDGELVTAAADPLCP